MIWDLIAAVCAGSGAAGIALFLRSISAKKFPSWTIPVFAGIGMLSVQIYSEYTWFDHQKSLLPDEVQVVKAVHEPSPLKPWTFIFPQVVRFAAIHVSEGARNQINPELVLADVYLFARRQPARRLHQVFHCKQNARAGFSENMHIPAAGEELNSQWTPVEGDDSLLTAACKGVNAQA